VRIPWTVISINWSMGKTSYFKFLGPRDSCMVKSMFEELHPGEVVIATIRGYHEYTTHTFPLSYPKEK